MSVIRPDLADAQPYRWQEGCPPIGRCTGST